MKLVLASVLVLLVVTVSPTFAQIESPITITTDKSSYSEGEVIIVTGEVRDLYSGTPVSVIILHPDGSNVSISQISVGNDKKFSLEVTAGGITMDVEGIYTVKAQYGTSARMSETFFEFGDIDVIDSEVMDTSTYIPQITNNTVTSPIQNEIPEWVRGIFVFWVDRQIDDQELIEAIKFLVDTKVIVLK